MLLSDRDIATRIETEELGLWPFDQARLQPASVDLTLAGTLRVPEPGVRYLDVERVPESHTRLAEMKDGGWLLRPGAFVLGSTVERISLPRDLSARVEGKSSVGRLGLAIHVTAGFIDPGFIGQVTLEIVNHAPWEIMLRENMPIAQLCLFAMSSPVARSYGQAGNHYQEQRGPTESRYRML